MNKFGNRPVQSGDNFGQTEESSQGKDCCLNETTRFDVTLFYEDDFVVQTAYSLNYAAYLKCQKKCPPNSFTTSDATSNAPPGGSGEVNIWATWKESQICSACTPGALRKAFRVEQCTHKGDDLFGGIQNPPISGDVVQMVNAFVVAMATDPPDQGDITGMMDDWVRDYCTKATCTTELLKLCSTVTPPPK